jgi:hypothetical protein
MDVSGFRRALTTCALAAVTAMCASCFLSAASALASVTTVASGLDNPRGLAFGPGGQLYVGEAGHGGPECIPGANPGGGDLCVGFTSGISRIDASGAHRIVSGLVSEASPDGSAATGIDGISALGNGTLFGIETEASDKVPTPPNKYLSDETIARARAELGRLIQANPGGQWRAVADVGHFDFQWSGELENKLKVPEQFPDANPYGVLATPGKRWVIDAASNSLDEVRPNGAISVVAFFPNPRVSDAVPTCIDRGPDGAFYVGELTGGGNGEGASVVWRVVPGAQPEAWATGLTAVTGCGFGSDGQFYATEFSTLGFESFQPGTGAVVRVPPHSTSQTSIASGLSFPGGFAAGPNGAIYVSNWSIAPANSIGHPPGEVVRIAP